MPVGRLNNVPTQDTYTDPLTIRFAYPRPAFSVQIVNAGIYYQVAATRPEMNMRDVEWEPAEHFSIPSLLGFNNPLHEGFAPGMLFIGFRVRSAVTGVPANVTVQ